MPINIIEAPFLLFNAYFLFLYSFPLPFSVFYYLDKHSHNLTLPWLAATSLFFTAGGICALSGCYWARSPLITVWIISSRIGIPFLSDGKQFDTVGRYQHDLRNFIMVGTITALLITYWFYKSAEATGKNPMSSAVLGFLAFLIPCAVWTFAVTPDLRDAVEHNPGTLSGLFVNYAYIVVGAACAAWVKHMHFKQAKS